MKVQSDRLFFLYFYLIGCQCAEFKFLEMFYVSLAYVEVVRTHPLVLIFKKSRLLSRCRPWSMSHSQPASREVYKTPALPLRFTLMFK
jgi:hypothetical protein